MGKQAKASTSQVKAAFNTLKIRPLKTIDADIKKVNASFTLLKNSGKLSMKEVARASKAAKTQIKQLNAEAGRVSGGFASMKSSVLAAAAGFYVMARAVMNVTEVFREFDDTMRMVGAVSNATGEEYTKLTDLALKMGATTRYTATQAAEGLKYLGMAGLTANQQLAALPPTLNLAAAAGMDLGRAADISTNVMTAYGLKAEELTRVSDVMTQAFTNSNSTTQELGEAFKYVGPVARALEVPFEELVASIALLHNAGIKGSMAGTSLRASMTKLLNPSNKGVAVMKALGQRIGQTALEVEDADGKFVGMQRVLEQLEGAAITGGEAMQLFGQRGGPAMLAMVSQSANGLKDFTELLEESGGRAEQVATDMEAGAGGTARRLKSAFEGVRISFGKFMERVLRPFKKALISLFDFFNKLPASIQMLVAGLTSLAAVLALCSTRAAILVGTQLANWLRVGTIAVGGLNIAIGVLLAQFALFAIAVIGVTGAIHLLFGLFGSTTTNNGMQSFTQGIVDTWVMLKVAVLEAWRIMKEAATFGMADTSGDKKRIQAIIDERAEHKKLMADKRKNLISEKEQEAVRAQQAQWAKNRQLVKLRGLDAEQRLIGEQRALQIELNELTIAGEDTAALKQKRKLELAKKYYIEMLVLNKKQQKIAEEAGLDKEVEQYKLKAIQLRTAAMNDLGDAYGEVADMVSGAYIDSMKEAKANIENHEKLISLIHEEFEARKKVSRAKISSGDESGYEDLLKDKVTNLAVLLKVQEDHNADVSQLGKEDYEQWKQALADKVAAADEAYGSLEAAYAQISRDDGRGFDEQRKALAKRAAAEVDGAKKTAVEKAQIDIEEAAQRVVRANELLANMDGLHQQDTANYLKAQEAKMKVVGDLEKMELDAIKRVTAARANVAKVEEQNANRTRSLAQEIRSAELDGMNETAALSAKKSDLAVKDEELRASLNDTTVAGQETTKRLYAETLALIKETTGEITKQVDGETRIIQSKAQGNANLQEQLHGLESVVAQMNDNAKSGAEQTQQEWEAALTAIQDKIAEVMVAQTLETTMVPSADEIQSIIAKMSEDIDTKWTVHKKVVEEGKSSNKDKVDGAIEASASGGLAGRGGYIPGQSNRDDVPSILMRGEYVVRKSAVQKYGVGMISALNAMKMPKKFAEGGLAGQDVADVISSKLDLTQHLQGMIPLPLQSLAKAPESSSVSTPTLGTLNLQIGDKKFPTQMDVGLAEELVKELSKSGMVIA